MDAEVQSTAPDPGCPSLDPDTTSQPIHIRTHAPELLHLPLQLALLVLEQRLVDGVGLGTEVQGKHRLPKHVVGKDVAAGRRWWEQ